MDVTVTQIVTHNENNVRSGRQGGEDIEQEGTEKTKEERPSGIRQSFSFHHKNRISGDQDGVAVYRAKPPPCHVFANKGTGQSSRMESRTEFIPLVSRLAIDPS